MGTLKPEIIQFGLEVTDLLEAWNFECYAEHFDSSVVKDVALYHIKNSYCYSESKFRCAIQIMAILLDAHKQITEMKKRYEEFPLALKPSISKRTH